MDYFPSIPEHPKTAAAAAPVTVHKALLLEDDLDLRAVMTEFLESKFFDVIGVNNGAEGMRQVIKHHFDVVICDLMMPKMPGILFYQAVQRVRPVLCRRFVFITGHKVSEGTTDFINRSASTILMKPFVLEDLYEAARFIVRHG